MKLTHEEASHRGDKEALGTYRLKPLREKPTLTDETHFYWTSGSQFMEALKHNPHIKKAHHSCGPGHTYDKIREILSGPVDIFLSPEEWKRAFQ